MEYKKTTWADNKTTVNAERLNNIENMLSKLASLSLTPGNMKTINGKSIVGSGNINISGLDLSNISVAELIEILGYTPASEDTMPIWESYEPDGTRTPSESADGIPPTNGILARTGQYCFGQFNVMKDEVLFAIGSGTDNTHRRNSLEIWKNGEVWIYGQGGYDGTNSGETGVYPASLSGGTGCGTGSPEPWVGTMAEYQELSEVDPKRIYYITKT